MNTQQLRQKVLDLAIHGKLVAQDPNEEPASALLERIKAEKEKSKPLSSFDIPFEIPTNWTWCLIDDITNNIKYGTSKKSSPEGKIAVLRMGNITKTGGLDYTDLVYSSDDEDIDKYMLHYGDILFNRTNSSEWVGKTTMYDGKIPAIYAGYIIRFTPIIVNPVYLNIVMNSSYERKYCYYVKTDAVNQSNINAKKLANMPIPLPPLEEQKRIVSEIEKWMHLIDIIEENQNGLNDNIEKAKAKILDLAVHGKLVAKEGKWKECSLEECADILDSFRKPINSTERQKRISQPNITLYPYYGATGQVGYIDDYLIDEDLILVGEDGAPFLDPFATKAYEINGKSWVNNHAHILKAKENQKYLLYYMNAVDYHPYVNGTTRLKLTQSQLRKIKVNLPPIEEQKRIVAKIEQLFAALDKMKQML